jgi:hypothetical protein
LSQLVPVTLACKTYSDRFSPIGRYITFVQVFAALLGTMPAVAVTRVVADFEVALWTAVRTVLPDVSIQGCYFHYAQAVWRKIQVDGLYCAT